MIRIHGSIDGSELQEEPDDLVWEALRRGILEQVKLVKVRTSWADLEALRNEMANPEHAAPEGADVPDDEAVT